VVAVSFNKVMTQQQSHFESRLSRLLEEPVRGGDPAPTILEDDDADVFSSGPEPVSFDAEEDLDIPDFLKS
jgi:hypothetical protein